MHARRVLITGAGSGLGLALAHRFAHAGCEVACVDLLGERAAEAAASLPGNGHLPFEADVGDAASMDALHAQVTQLWPALDVLINNAGIASGGGLLDATPEEWQRLLNVNLMGVVRGCRLFLPTMIDRGRGQIVNVASFAGLAGAPYIMSYGVAKAAVVALSEQLRAEVVNEGIKVSVVCPAFFRTNLLQNFEGDTRMRQTAARLMERSPDSLDSVADKVFAGIEQGRFLILPTRREPMFWRLKRWFPELYFRQMRKLAVRSLRS
ncbi:MAG TPA: short-chain dehydrogenase [Xanthomonadales bacterium]|nr:short-chain dehydrogenase [Xanthomonadales bacterium]